MEIDLNYEDFGSLVLEFERVAYQEEVHHEKSPTQLA